MKFRGKGLLAKPHEKALSFFDLATRGLRKLAWKVKIFAFWAFEFSIATRNIHHVTCKSHFQYKYLDIS